VTGSAAGAAGTLRLRASAAGCVRELVRAAATTGYVPMGPVEVEELLGGLVGQLVDALFAEPFQAAPGYQVGAALVGADFVGPEMVGRTVRVLSSRLLADIGADTGEMRARLAALMGGVSTGYARALRDRVLDDQEETRRATMVATHLAQQAVRVSEQRRWWDARHDPLTGLANRALFTERLAAALADAAGAGRVGVCLLGLDRFSAVNDSLGRQAGDELLVAVGRRLEQQFGPPERLVARIGGDQFAVLVGVPAAARIEDLDAVAEQALAAPFGLGGHRLHLPASAGVAAGQTGHDPVELVRAAEVTLRWAKADGGGRWLRFDPDRYAADRRRWALTAELPAALYRGEFILDYQPIVRLADRRVRGLEALVRWAHPQRGRLGPDQFVGLAEETGLIVDLGRWVLQQACREASRWAELTPAPPFVSVNVAVRQIRHPGLAQDVAVALAGAGLPPGRLQLEITESGLMRPDSRPLSTLRAIADTGVRVAIDDFGTGWANYAHLRTLPVREIKLAASFLDRLRGPEPADPVDQQVVAGLVALAHTLDLTVTAEGVETAAQAERLHRLGCDAGQGWHLGRPEPPDRLADLLTPSGG